MCGKLCLPPIPQHPRATNAKLNLNYLHWKMEKKEDFIMREKGGKKEEAKYLENISSWVIIKFYSE